MAYGIITDCEITGKRGVSATDIDPINYFHTLTEAEHGFIKIGDRSDANFKCEINVDAKNKLTLFFHDAGNQLLGSVYIDDETFYDHIRTYRHSIAEYNEALLTGTIDDIGLTNKTRSEVHGRATQAMIDLLAHAVRTPAGHDVPVTFDGDNLNKPTRALFYLCAYAVDAQPAMR